MVCQSSVAPRQAAAIKSGVEPPHSKASSIGCRNIADRLKYLGLCALIGACYLLFALFVALKKAQYASVDRPLMVALAVALPGVYLLSSAVWLFWRRNIENVWPTAAIYDLLFYAFLPVSVAGVCGIELLGEITLVRIFIIAAGLKLFASVYFMAKACDSGSGRWPTIFLGTALSLCVLFAIVATGGNRMQVTYSLAIEPHTFVSIKNDSLSFQVDKEVRATRIRLKTSLIHSGPTLQGTKLARLKVLGADGSSFEFDFLAGVHSSEKCYELPNTRVHMRHIRAHAGRSAAEFLAHGQTYIGRVSSATFTFPERIRPVSVEFGLAMS
ncbi:hypothetical protein J7M28_05110 [bacterium]|nr:hypothetical protein [bacterium]